jgi:hypothetical protein
MNKRLYKALCLIEDTITTLIAFACFVVMVAEVDGSLMHYIVVKLVALAIFTAIVCFEGK